MKNAPINFALGTLAASVIWILFEHLMGWNTTDHFIGQYARMMPMILFWIMLVVCIWYIRRGNGNTLTFKEGFRSGLVMTLIYCLGFTIVIILYSKFLNPTMQETMNEFMKQQLQEGSLTQKQYDDAMKENEMVYSGTALSYLWLFIFSFIWGVGITALATIILRRNPTAP